MELLNEDLGTEYQSIVQYTNHIATITGPEYLSILDELKVHVGQELSHAQILAEQVSFLGGEPIVTVPPVERAADSRAALRGRPAPRERPARALPPALRPGQRAGTGRRGRGAAPLARADPRARARPQDGAWGTEPGPCVRHLERVVGPVISGSVDELGADRATSEKSGTQCDERPAQRTTGACHQRGLSGPGRAFTDLFLCRNCCRPSSSLWRSRASSWAKYGCMGTPVVTGEKGMSVRGRRLRPSSRKMPYERCRQRERTMSARRPRREGDVLARCRSGRQSQTDGPSGAAHTDIRVIG